MSKILTDAAWDYFVRENDVLMAGTIIKLLVGCDIQATPHEHALAETFKGDIDRVNELVEKQRRQRAERQARFREKNKAVTDVSHNAEEPHVTQSNGDSALRNADVTQSNAQSSQVKSGQVKSSQVSKEEKNNTSIIKKETRFSKPTVEEIKAYCAERNNGIDAEKFFDYNEAKGWKIGNSPMKDWKAAVRTWERKNSTPPPAQWNAADAPLSYAQTQAVYSVLVEKYGMRDDRRTGDTPLLHNLTYDIDSFIINHHREKGLEASRDYGERLRWLFANFPECKTAAESQKG